MVLGTLAAAAVWRSQLLRPRGDLAAADPADRAARHRHRHRAALGLRPRSTSRSASGPSSSATPPSASWSSTTTCWRASGAPRSSQIEASMDLGANGFQTFRYVVLPNIATALLAGGMLAFALVLRRGHRHHLHRRPADHAADLDADRAGAPAPAAGHQRGRGVRHRRDLPPDPRRLSTSRATRTRWRAAESSRESSHGRQRTCE